MTDTQTRMLTLRILMAEVIIEDTIQQSAEAAWHDLSGRLNHARRCLGQQVRRAEEEIHRAHRQNGRTR